MKVTVKDCLELEGFANARVLAGGKNLEGLSDALNALIEAVKA